MQRCSSLVPWSFIVIIKYHAPCITVWATLPYDRQAAQRVLTRHRHPPAHVRCPARPRDNGRDPRCSRGPVCRVRSDAGQSVAMPRTAAGCHRHHPRMSAVSLRSWTVTPQGCFWTGMGSCRVGRRLSKTFCNTGIVDAPDLGG